MHLADQIAAVAWRGPLAPLRARARTARWLLAYVALSATLLGVVGGLLVAHRADLRRLLLDYLLPTDWHAVADYLIDRFVVFQARPVLVNAALSGAVLLISTVLFPLKERLSAVFEDEAGLTGRTPDPFPRWFQALEEAKLAVLYVTAQLTVLWIGYPPDPRRRALATALSYAYLFGSYGVNFVAPVLQRHRLRYAAILRALAVRPLLLFGFGAVFALPPVLMARAAGTLSRGELAALFGLQIATLGWAVLAGTRVGAALLPEAQATRPPPPPVRWLGWLALAALLGAEGWLTGVVALSVHHKSQILKCRWSVDWGSFDWDRPSLGALLDGRVDVAVRFDVEVRNPTPFDVVFEDNRLELRHAGTLVATAALTPMTVPAGGVTRQPVGTRLELEASSLLEGRRLLDDRWNATLFVRVAPDVELPVYLLGTKTE
jgi:hypothetical protein